MSDVNFIQNQLNDLKRGFEGHLKEAEELKREFFNLQNEVESQQEVMEKMSAQLNEVHDILIAFKGGKKFIFGLLTLIGSIIAISIGILKLFNN